MLAKAGTLHNGEKVDTRLRGHNEGTDTSASRVVGRRRLRHHIVMVNRLYCGDNLNVLRESIVDASVDLVYLDPPFNSNAGYNLLY
jgi:16S rRNA G966 N2-methylase RsmD